MTRVESSHSNIPNIIGISDERSEVRFVVLDGSKLTPAIQNLVITLMPLNISIWKEDSVVNSQSFADRSEKGCRAFNEGSEFCHKKSRIDIYLLHELRLQVKGIAVLLTRFISIYLSADA